MEKSWDMSTENAAMAQRLATIIANNQLGNERLGRGSRTTWEEEQKRLKQQQLDADTNIASSALKGGAIGAMGGPWGAAFGAGIGGGLGLLKGVGARRKAGQGWWDVIKGTANDVFNPVEIGTDALDALSAPGGMQNALSMASPWAQKYGKKFENMMDRRAQDRAIRSAASSAVLAAPITQATEAPGYDQSWDPNAPNPLRPSLPPLPFYR